MLKIIAYISFAFAAVFALLLIVSLLQNISKKSKKNRNQIRSRIRLNAVAGVIFFLAGIALLMIPQKEFVLKQFISDVSPEDGYERSEDVKDLPSRIYAVGDDYYICTGNGMVYGHLSFVEEGEKEGEEKVTYQNGLCCNKTNKVAGGSKLLAFLSDKGALRLNGAFEYLAYEKDDTLFSNALYAKDCSFIDATDNNLMYVSGGDLYSAGYNAFGQLGDGTERNRVKGDMILEKVGSVSVSDTHTMAVDIYGNLYGFGDNSYSEMGNRTTAESGTPIRLMTGVRQAEAGKYFTIVLTKNGEVYAAGRNDLGQLGTGDLRDYATYKKIMDGVMQIAVGEDSCAALTAEGALYVWGNNSDGHLGAKEKVIDRPKKIAEDVYDVAMGKCSMGIIRLDRDVEVSGVARVETNVPFFEVYTFDAKVDEEERYREKIEMPEQPE